MGRHAYTPEQSAWLAERFPTTPNRQLAEEFEERFGERVTATAMSSWGGNHHMRKEPWVRGMANRKYTDEQLDFLREAIPGRSLSQVNDLYEERFGARLTRAALCGLRSKLGVYCGVNAGRFRRGQEPPNKGRTWDEMGIGEEARERMRATQFRKGSLPHNTRPLLDVRETRHGEVEIHVGLSRRERANDQWIPLAHFNWMQANGRDWPDGCKAIHIDRDPTNDAADNIEPVPTDLWPLVMGAVPGQMEWHDRETLRTAILYARVTRARTDAARRSRIADGRPRKGDIRPDGGKVDQLPTVAPTEANTGLTGRHRGIGDVEKGEGAGMSEVRVGSGKDLVTVTDELRRMLDERGVHWRAVEDERKTLWESNGLTWEYFNNENGDAWLGFLGACEQDVTPEQAIAATLGATDAKPTEAESSGTCRNVAVPDEYSDRPFTCSECGARGPMGNGTYHLASSWSMEDGTLAFADSWPVWKYCPACGAKVVDPTTNDVDAEVTNG